MAQKASIYVCLRLIFVVLAVAAVAQSTCIDTIHEIQNKQGGRMLMGGYRAVQNPLEDKAIQGIMGDIEKEYNKKSNDMHHFEMSVNAGIEAYSQLVNGQKYCVQITLVSAGCKNGVKGEFCSSEKQVTCAVSAFRAIDEKAAIIDRDTLECKASQ